MAFRGNTLKLHHNSGLRMRARQVFSRRPCLTEFKLRSYTPPRPFRLKNLSNSETSTNNAYGFVSKETAGRILALDLGEKRVGAAITDEMRLSVRTLPPLHRTNWKELLRAVSELVRGFDAKALVIGLPLNLDGTEGNAAKEARRIAGNFKLSLKIPVHLQDERLTSREAEEYLRASGCTEREVQEQVDSQSAAIILRDFLESKASE
ncbi:MAG: Holliday junction resolvase RuvX [Acidobacteria bacterium]|nr:MAG: Holliday junction resolvase RuvX [Acidobacteriota bacterium]